MSIMKCFLKVLQGIATCTKLRGWSNDFPEQLQDGGRRTKLRTG